MPALSLTVPHDVGATCDVIPRTDSLRFGDGYAQAATHGINVLGKTWSLPFTDRDKSETDAVEAVLVSALAGHFLWTQPGDGTPTKWRPVPGKPWQHYPTAYGWSLICEIERVF